MNMRPNTLLSIFLLMKVIESLSSRSLDIRYYTVSWISKESKVEQKAMHIQSKLLKDTFNKNEEYIFASTIFHEPYYEISLKDGSTFQYSKKVVLKIQIPSNEFKDMYNSSLATFNCKQAKLSVLFEEVNPTDRRGTSKVLHVSPQTLSYSFKYKEGAQFSLQSQEYSLSFNFLEIQPSQYMKLYKICNYCGFISAMGAFWLLKKDLESKPSPEKYWVDPLLYFYILQTSYSIFIDEMVFHYFYIFPSSIEHLISLVQITLWVFILFLLSPKFHKYYKDLVIFCDMSAACLLCISYEYSMLIAFTIYRVVATYLQAKQKRKDDTYHSKKMIWNMATMALIVFLKVRKDIDLRHFAFVFQEIPFSSIAPCKINVYQLLLFILNLVLSLPRCSIKLQKILSSYWNTICGKMAYKNILQEEERHSSQQQILESTEVMSRQQLTCS